VLFFVYIFSELVQSVYNCNQFSIHFNEAWNNYKAIIKQLCTKKDKKTHLDELISSFLFFQIVISFEIGTVRIDFNES
jgi:hypothetical protein